MDIYHHLENTKVYLRPSTGTDVYELDVLASGASFSQTFTENTYSEKTLHSQDSLVKNGCIKKASPASFAFSVPLLKEADFDTPVFNMLVDLTSSNTLKTFDLWFIEQSKAFCIESCVFTNGAFDIQAGSILNVALSGEGTKLTCGDNSGVEVINGTTITFTNIVNDISTFPVFTAAHLQARSGTRTFLPINKVLVQKRSNYGTSGGKVTQVAYADENLISSSMELQNNISWVAYSTVNGGISTTSRETAEYPTTFTLNDRALAGNAKWAMDTRDATEAINNFSNTTATGGANGHFYENSPWTTAVFSTISGTDYGITFRATSGVNITTRVTPGAYYTMDMDWRLASNSSNISSLLTYTTA